MNIFLKPMEEILKSTQEKGKITSTQELADFFLKKVNETEDMTQKHRADMDARIMAKLKAGKKLTPEELNYLRRTNSMMYAQALRIQHMAEAVEEQLKHAKSKEEADRIVSSTLLGVSKNDPAREYIVAAVNRISSEFHKSGAYNKLPGTIEEAEKKKEGNNENAFSGGKEEEEKIDLKNWSPLQEVFDQMPTFSAGA